MTSNADQPQLTPARPGPVPLRPGSPSRGRLDSIPRSLTSFIGREREVAAVTALLRRDDVRLVTLTGSGGVGKTRLARQVATELVADFPDGVAFVSLAPIADPALVGPTITRALAVREGDQPLIARLQAALHDRHLLLVLDNFEQVLAAAPIVTDLLGACPRLTLLVTSREDLHLTGERVFPVPPLALPDPAHLPPVDELTEVAAVRLFVERAQAATPDFAVTAKNGAAVAAICARLDGLPLAIELAAARSAVLAPAALLARLERRLPLLTGGPRDQPDRLRTMRAAIAWSHDLLPPEEQTLFRCLAVFVGGCTLEAAETVCGPQSGDDDRTPPDSRLPSPDSVLEGIASLVAKNLLRPQESPSGEPRFVMFETIREFGLEALAASGEEAEIRSRHAAWIFSLVERAESPLWSNEQRAWLARLDADLDNLRLALTWWTENGNPDTGLRLAAALVRYWCLRPIYLAEGRTWLERALTHGRTAGAAARAQALVGAGAVAKDHGHFALAVSLLEDGLALARGSGEVATAARALVNLGITARYRNDLDEAERLLREAVQSGEHRFAAYALDNLGVVALLRGDVTGAVALHMRALTIARATSDAWGIAVALYRLGFAALRQGDREQALASFTESIAIWPEHGDLWTLSESIEGIASLAVGERAWTPAARLFGAAEALRAALGVPLVPDWRAGHEHDVAAVAARLGPDAFADAWQAGQALPLEEAIALGASVAVPGDGAPAGETQPRPIASAVDALSRREREVLPLLARGLSNRQIADELSIGERTVESHVASILAKWNLTNRAQIAAATAAESSPQR